MPLKTYTGRASVIPGQIKITVNSATATNTVALSIGVRTETYTIPASATTSSVALAFASQLQNSKAPEFSELLFVAVAADIFITHTDYTMAFDVTVGGTGGVLTKTVIATTTGPGDWGSASNWSDGTLPVAADDILVDLPDTPITQNLDALAAIAIGVMTVKNRANFGIGLPRFRRQGALIYLEYRTRFVSLLTIGSLVVDGDGAGCRVLNVTALGSGGAGNCASSVSSNNNVSTDEEAPIQLDMRGTGNTLDHSRGLVQIPTTGVFATVRCGRETVNDEAPILWNDGTISTSLHNQSAETRSTTALTLTMDREAEEHDQIAGALTATVQGGTLIHRPAATLTVTANGPLATVDVSRTTNAKTLQASSTFRDGCAFVDPHGRCTGIRGYFDSLSLQNSVLGDAA